MKTQNILSFILFSIIMLWGNISLAATSKPTVTITVAQSPIVYGGTGTISWSSTNATSCTASGGWTGAKPTSGTYITPSLTKSTTYSISCTGNGGSKSASVTESVKSASISPPIVNLSASITAAPYQGSATLTWTTLNTALQLRPLFAQHGKMLEAAKAKVELAQSDYYPDFTVGGGYAFRQNTPTGQGRSDFASVQLSMNVPIYANHKQAKAVDQRKSELLQEQYALKDEHHKIQALNTSSVATPCTASGGWSGAKAASGSVTLASLSNTATYTLTW